jgi:hypothetical protein
MTEEQIIERGLSAEHILTSTDYAALFDMVVQDMAMAVLNTGLEETKQRENYYLTIQGLRAFTNQINAYRTAKDELVERRNADEEQREDD